MPKVNNDPQTVATCMHDIVVHRQSNSKSRSGEREAIVILIMDLYILDPRHVPIATKKIRLVINLLQLIN